MASCGAGPAAASIRTTKYGYSGSARLDTIAPRLAKNVLKNATSTGAGPGSKGGRSCPENSPILKRSCCTAAITAAIHAMIEKVQEYVPGYRLKNGPVFDGRRVSTFLEVEGLGDYLPKYAGNLDIMTAAALKTAELIADNLARKAEVV